ncbi:hypothetical protein DL98DRAFT_520299 [Cadophora sp. DSE1049]|nr:hypothetical protein DL98DRAFT_520299 [Cadophora sp. DSE1049]
MDWTGLDCPVVLEFNLIPSSALLSSDLSSTTTNRTNQLCNERTRKPEGPDGRTDGRASIITTTSHHLSTCGLAEMTPDSTSTLRAQSHDEKATCGITEGERQSETLYNAETSTRKWKREHRKRYKKQSHEGKASITEGEKQSETTLQNEQTSMEQITPKKRFRKRYRKKKPKMNFIATKTEYYGSLHAHCHECKKQEPQPVMDGDILVQPSGAKRKLILRKGCLAFGTP